jgi:hypothetical protein
MWVQGGAFGEEARFEVGGTGVHMGISLGSSREIRRGCPSPRSAIAAHDARERAEPQAANAASAHAARVERHKALDSRAQLAGRGVASSDLLLEKLVQERPEVEQVREPEASTAGGGNEERIGQREIGPCAGDTKDGAIGEQEDDPVEAADRIAVKQREALAIEGVERMRDEDGRITRSGCSLLG